MPVQALFVPALIGGLGSAMGTFAGRVMVALGITAVTYSGITLGVLAIKNQVIANINALPMDALNLVGYLWIDKGLTLYFSAVAAALTLKTVGGSAKKMVMK